MQIQSKAIVLGVITRNEQILIINRAIIETMQDGSKLSWALPGGKVEINESSNEAIVREVREETGYSVTANKVIYSGIHPLSKRDVTYWECQLESESPEIDNPNTAIADVRWVYIKDIGRYFTSSLHPAVKQYLNIE